MTPLVLCGEYHGVKTVWLKVLGWGRMWNTWEPQFRYDGEPWGFDNGAFGAWTRGRSWDADAYRIRLERAVTIADANRPPIVPVLPDKPAEGLRSLEFSLKWLDSRTLPNWPWFLAVQDGMTIADVEPHVHRFGGLFLGGSDDFKPTAPDWSELAHANGKRFHYGRCGNVAKLRLARAAGSDSLDSTGIMRNDIRDNSLAKFVKEMIEPRREAALFE